VILPGDIAGLAGHVRSGAISAETVVRMALDDIAARDPALNCFTAIFTEHALQEARRIDADLSSGHSPGTLAGVPFAAKDLFDVAGRTTRAGSKLRLAAAPAERDAVLVRRLKAAGAILLGLLNMDEFAYGFSTENTHYGTTRNPYDTARIAGGSSGGSAASVAAGLVPFALGSDTNGSIRVPAALCGVYGMKPTFGRLPRTGIAAFSASLDHGGHFARSARDLAAVYACMAGPDAGDPACVADPVPETGTSPEDWQGLRVGLLGGWFRDGATEAALTATEKVAAAFHAARPLDLPEVARARSAAFCITAAEGGNLHLDDLRRRPADFDPGTRERFLAGALLPANVLLQAQRFRRWFQGQVAKIFTGFDLLLAPATPCAAPLIGQDGMQLGQAHIPVRANLGIYTQPISFIGLPVISVPVHVPGELPLGVQMIGKPWSEYLLLDVAAKLEEAGAIGFVPPPPRAP
jgi:AtzE family amidohydrolase